MKIRGIIIPTERDFNEEFEYKIVNLQVKVYRHLFRYLTTLLSLCSLELQECAIVIPPQIILSKKKSKEKLLFFANESYMYIGVEIIILLVFLTIYGGTDKYIHQIFASLLWNIIELAFVPFSDEWNCI